MVEKCQESTQEHLTRNLTCEDVYQQKERKTPTNEEPAYKPELDCLRRIKFKLSWRYDNIDSATKIEKNPRTNMETDTPADDKPKLFDHMISTSLNSTTPSCKVSEEREGKEEEEEEEKEAEEEMEKEEVVMDGEVQHLEMCATDGEVYCEGVDDDRESLEATTNSVDIGQMMTSLTTLYNSTNVNGPKAVEMADEANTTLLSPYASSSTEAMDQGSDAYSNQLSDSDQPHSTISQDDVTMTAYTNQGTSRWEDMAGEMCLKNSIVESSDDSEMSSFEIKTEFIDEGFVDSNNNSEFVLDMNVHS